MTTQKKRDFVTAIEKSHGRQLRHFLSARMRNAAADLPDLVQEIFLRLLRVKDHEAIRNPQAYLYTVASHVLHQHGLREAARPQTMDPLDIVSALDTAAAPDPAVETEIEQAFDNLRTAIEARSPRAYATLLMYRCEGLTLQEIGDTFGVSRPMAKKYLLRAIALCDEYLEDEETRTHR